MDKGALFSPHKIAGRQAARAAPRARAGGPGPAERALAKSALPELTWKPVSGARSKSGAIKAVP
jgi:hypothetical protein